MGHPFVQTQKLSLSPDGLKSLMARIRTAACKLWPTACVFAALIALAALLVLGTRVSGNSNVVGFYTPVAASFGALYCVPVIAALALFRMGKLQEFSRLASIALCVLVIVFSVIQSLAGSSRSFALYATCFVEIGCLSVWCLYARRLPLPDCLLEGCTVIALSCLMTIAFLIANYLVTDCLGLPVFLPVLPIAVHAILCKHAQAPSGSLPEDVFLAGEPRSIDIRALMASASLGFALSCSASLLFRSWLNATVPDTAALGSICCGCLLAMGVLAVFSHRVLACLASPCLFCSMAILSGALFSPGQQSTPVFQLVFFTGGVVCAAFVLMSAIPSPCASIGSSRLSGLDMRLCLVALACGFFEPTLEVMGALIGDADILIQLCLLTSAVYGASCYWLHAASTKQSNATEIDAFQPNAISMVAQKYDLTVRESDVLRELFNGRTASYIARDLSVSINTVRSHTKHIYTKLSVHSQQELIDLIKSLMLPKENSY